MPRAIFLRSHLFNILGKVFFLLTDDDEVLEDLPLSLFLYRIAFDIRDHEREV
jgi:hypothetical protein